MRAGRVRVGTYLLAGALLLPFLVVAYIGQYARYVADDYCHAAIANELGFWHAQVYWYLGWTGRSATIAIITPVYLAGPTATILVPAVGAALWIATGAVAGRYLLARVVPGAPALLLAVLGVAVTFAAINTNQERGQLLFWPLVIVAYLLPLTIGVLVAVGVATGRLTALTAALGAFVAGWFSDVFAVYQPCAWGLVVLWRAWGDRRLAFGSPAMGGFVGSTTVLTVGLLAPGVAVRAAAMPGASSTSLIDAAAIAAYKLLAFDLYRLILWTPAALAFVLVVAFAAGLLGVPDRAGARELLLRIGLTALAAWVLAFVVFYPGAYLNGDIPPFRAHIFSRLTFLVAASVVASWVGRAIAARWSEAARSTLAAVALAAATLYPAAGAVGLAGTGPVARAYAEGWDGMAVQATEARRRGETELIVAYQPSYLPGSDLGRDPTHWVNQCAARYFGFNTVRAI